jgi:ABC-type branched-subunit amino acid transport system permease subunit
VTGFFSRYCRSPCYCAVYLLIVFWVQSSYYQLIMILVAVWAVMGISWNVLSGYSGLISFGHASFFGLGAFTVVLGQIYFGITPWIGIPLAGIVGALAGLIVGYPTFRLRGHYFALAMLAYPLALLYVFEWLGYQEVTIPMVRENPAAYMQFADRRVYAIIALVLLAIAVVVSRLIEASRFGMSLLAIKQNELAAEAAGIETRKWKLRAIAVSGAIAGTIGGFYCRRSSGGHAADRVRRADFRAGLVVTLFGGVGTVWGPIVGATILIPLAETLHAELGHFLHGIHGVVYGLAIVLIILLAPDGLLWKLRDTSAAIDAGPGSPSQKPLRRQSRTWSRSRNAPTRWLAAPCWRCATSPNPSGA